MSNNSDKSKRIAKNTILLYFRMLLIMAVTLYTSRIVLITLGVEDYGIYNVVGGVVTMFAVLSGSLSTAISRFITYELGKGNHNRLKIIFSSSIIIQVTLALIIGILAEIGGTWFMNNKMNIPFERLEAANWVLQCSIVTFMVNLISVPYNAAIIAHEKMKAFAYVSIFEASLKLLVVFVLYFAVTDKLKIYAISLMIISILIRFIYSTYCKNHFAECKFHMIYDKNVLKEIGKFAGWNFIGSSSAIFRDQGGNIVLNLFCGPVVNAARGIAFQVHTAVYGFITNFMTALNPQIIKTYANADKNYLMFLLYQGSRFSFYLLLLLSLPILLNTNYILQIWLTEVPKHTVNFVQLVLIFALSESISQPLITAQSATGKIRNYQIVVGGLQMLNLPTSYLLLKNGCVPESVLIVSVIISQACLAARLYMLRKSIDLSPTLFIKKVYINALYVSCVAIALPLILSKSTEESFGLFCANCLLTILCTLLSIIYIGCSSEERKKIRLKIFSLFSKFAN